MTKKISPYDKFQALKRNPGYQAEYKEFACWCRERNINPKNYYDHPEASQKAEKLCRKYGVYYLFNPMVKLSRSRGGDYFLENDIVEVIYPNKYRELSNEEFSRGKRPKYLPIPIFDRGNHLVLKIDLTMGEDTIFNEVKSKINYYHYFIRNSKRRLSKDRLVNKWYVFDIYNETKSFRKTLNYILSKAKSEVTFLKSLGGDAEIPKIDISTVRKAYYRAFELVYGETYNPEKHTPKKLPPNLTKKCSSCPEREVCDTMCPDIMEYVKQDEKYLREKLPNISVENEMQKLIKKKLGFQKNYGIGEEDSDELYYHNDDIEGDE